MFINDINLSHYPSTHPAIFIFQVAPATVGSLTLAEEASAFPAYSQYGKLQDVLGENDDTFDGTGEDNVSLLFANNPNLERAIETLVAHEDKTPRLSADDSERSCIVTPAPDSVSREVAAQLLVAKAAVPGPTAQLDCNNNTATPNPWVIVDQVMIYNICND